MDWAMEWHWTNTLFNAQMEKGWKNGEKKKKTNQNEIAFFRFNRSIVPFHTSLPPIWFRFSPFLCFMYWCELWMDWDYSKVYSIHSTHSHTSTKRIAKTLYHFIHYLRKRRICIMMSDFSFAFYSFNLVTHVTATRYAPFCTHTQTPSHTYWVIAIADYCQNAVATTSFYTWFWIRRCNTYMHNIHICISVWGTNDLTTKMTTMPSQQQGLEWHGI